MSGYLRGKFGGEGLGSLLGRLQRDECGAVAVEKLLLLVAIALPLVGVLIVFRDDIAKWVNEIWTGIKGRAPEPQVTP